MVIHIENKTIKVLTPDINLVNLTKYLFKSKLVLCYFYKYDKNPKIKGDANILKLSKW